MSMKAALFYNYPSALEGEVFGQGRRERIETLTNLYPHVVHAGNFDEHAAKLSDIEVIFATWGMMNFTAEQRAKLPKLKAVFYAAGNVKAFAPSLIDNGIILVSAWAINSIPPAEMCLSQVLLSLRGYFRTVRQYRETKTHAAKSYWRPGVMDETIGLIGLGYIGSLLRKKLADYPLQVIAHDPFLTKERAIELDVTPVSLEELFAKSYIVSNHIPDLPTTRGVLTRKLFETLREGATFINTGRGAQVVEADLIAVLKERPDLTALARRDLAGAATAEFGIVAAAQCRHQPTYRRHHRPRGRPPCRLRHRGVRALAGGQTAALSGDARHFPHHGVTMAHWLMKSEPGTWSWQQQQKSGAKGEAWSGVRNHQAKLNLMKMKKGDRAFFYHSGEEKAVVGIVEIIREHYPDPTAKPGEPWVVVDVKAIEPLPKPVTIADVMKGAEAQDHGAHQQHAAVGAAGDRCGMEDRVQDGRLKQEGSMTFAASILGGTGGGHRRICARRRLVRLLAAPWKAAHGNTIEQIRAASRQGRCTLAAAAGARRRHGHGRMLSGVVGHLGEVTFKRGVISAGFIWLGFVLTTIAVNNTFGMRSPRLILIDGGHWLAALLLMGGDLGVWGA